MKSGKPNPARQAYLKKWRKEHPDRIKVYNQRYWEKKLKEYLENEQKKGEQK